MTGYIWLKQVRSDYVRFYHVSTA